MIKRILLLGGTGTIGQYLSMLYKKDIDVEVYITSRSYRVDDGNLHYVVGNAHDIDFLTALLNSSKWNAVVDFMSYKTEEFKKRIDLLLKKTERYVYISSSRVFAESLGKPITEESPRLLDTCSDHLYLSTDEYALTKARQENILFKHCKRNWTIIRPYITFGKDRLQLGIYEKELWLFRALNKKPIVFPRDIASKITTLTPNSDVAGFIYNAIKRDDTLGNAYNVTGEYNVTWKSVCDLYVDTIEATTGTRPTVIYTDNPVIQPGSEYQYKYDRSFDRKFCNSKASPIYPITTSHVEKCLKQSVSEFIQEKLPFKSISWRIEGIMDRQSKSFQNLRTIPTFRNKFVYLIYRLFPLSL